MRKLKMKKLFGILNTCNLYLYLRKFSSLDLEMKECHLHWNLYKKNIMTRLRIWGEDQKFAAKMVGTSHYHPNPRHIFIRILETFCH